MKDVNSIKQRLKEGKSVIGTFLMIPSADLVEMVGYAGFDFVLLDIEHGRFNIETLENLIRAADSVDLPPLVRLPNDANLILHTLECGCLGIQVSMVGTKEDALAVVETCKYYPEGKRGMAFSTRAGHYGARGIERHMEMSNREILVAIQIEGIKGVENLPEILTVQGIDVVFIGPMDLSQSLGVPGQINHSKVLQTIGHVVSQVTDAGFTPGIFAGNAEMARKWISRGFKYVALSTGIMFKSLQEMVERIKAE